MTKNQISTMNAPAAIGPYSQGICVGELIFTSGQLPINMQTGELEMDVKKATIASLKNIEAILHQVGAELSDIIKTTVFVKDMNDFAEVNKTYATFFEGVAPARSCVEVARLPKDVVIEIEAIAVKK